MTDRPDQLTRIERLLERTYALVQEVAREQARQGRVLDHLDQRLASLESRMAALGSRLELTGLGFVTHGDVPQEEVHG